MNGTHRKPARLRITDAGDAIRRRETFTAGDGSLTGGHAGTDTTPARGRLPQAWHFHWQGAVNAHGAALYVVRSYGTPIAWAGPGEALTVPAVSYSPTISRHQGMARRADGLTADLPAAPMAGVPFYGNGYAL